MTLKNENSVPKIQRNEGIISFNNKSLHKKEKLTAHHNTKKKQIITRPNVKH